MGFDNFIKKLADCDLIGMENWTMLPHMSSIWKSFISDVVPVLKEQTDIAKKTMFFDLADPEKRSEKDIKEAVALLEQFTREGFKTALGLNKKEACELVELYGESICNYKSYPLNKLAEKLYAHIGTEYIVIHPVDRACCISQNGYSEVKGPYCQKPLITTGAGDNFNAGFIYGFMNGYSDKECLLCGVCASGYYVRNAKSPTTAQLAEFISNL